MDASQDTIAGRRRSRLGGRRVDVIVGAAALCAVAVTSPAATATPHGKTVPASAAASASPAPSEHNARVAEYLLLRHRSQAADGSPR